MSTEAYDVIQAVKTLLDTNKSIVQTVTTTYQTLEALEDDMRRNPGNYPKAIVYFGANETPSGAGQTIGNTLRAFLPISVDIYQQQVTDIQLEREQSLKEMRDLLENEANGILTVNQHRIILPIVSVQRLITYATNNPREVIIGLATININVRYSYTQGDS